MRISLVCRPTVPPHKIMPAERSSTGECSYYVLVQDKIDYSFHQDIFEADPDDKTRIICRPCQVHHGDKGIAKKSKSKHIQTEKHRVALDVWSIDTSAGPSTLPSMPTVEPATLRLAHHFGESEQPTQPNFPTPVEPAPFEEIYSGIGGDFVDVDGNEIQFSAGPNPVEEQNARMRGIIQ